VDRLAARGDPRAFRFPDPSLHKGEHRYDVSFSGLKTAVINQLDQFWDRRYEKSAQNIAAAFQKAAVDILLKRLFRAVQDTGIRRIVVGGGVAANSYLRAALQNREDLRVYFPSMELCTDNGAMIAGLGYHDLVKGETSPLSENAYSRVPSFKRTYP
jgi:N6-L-threonylcarbamoyladenine synthase